MPDENILKGHCGGKSCTEIISCVPLGNVVPVCFGRHNKAGRASLWTREAYLPG